MVPRVVRYLMSFLKGDDGPTAVEYAVLLAFIIIVCLVAIGALGSNSNSTFNQVGTELVGPQQQQSQPSGPAAP